MKKRRIAILGGGPSALFMYKRFVETGDKEFEISIFEKNDRLGAGMPYSKEGANKEHVTNVSDNELPEIVTSIDEWVKTAPQHLLQRFDITPENFNEKKVLPRLFFGEYLSAQFEILLQQAKNTGIVTHVRFNTIVADIIDNADSNTVSVVTGDETAYQFDAVVICTGHSWPDEHEGVNKGYFDSPYPPSKLELKTNYPVAIKGSSLTAIDAVRTLARNNGKFIEQEDGMLSFRVNSGSEGFKIEMYSIGGFLPAIRTHLEDSHLSRNSVLSIEEAAAIKAANGGFIPLDLLFETNFKQHFLEKDAAFYERIKSMSIEEFVDDMMSLREELDAFVLFKAEYAEAEKSIKKEQSVYWKEMLAVLRFAMNYPAKHFSAEDMLRLQKVLKPLISIVIAFVPQAPAKELIALNGAGVLNLIAVDDESKVVPDEKQGAVYHYRDEEGKQQQKHYKLFIDCTGQPALSYDEFPFRTLLKSKTLSPARIKFKNNEEGKALSEINKDVEQDANGDYYLKVPGITINDYFQVVDEYGAFNNRIYIMAVPYIGGFNPDYSGLDFCEEASARIMEGLTEH